MEEKCRVDEDFSSEALLVRREGLSLIWLK
jgi:hypothetical protein